MFGQNWHDVKIDGMCTQCTAILVQKMGAGKDLSKSVSGYFMNKKKIKQIYGY